MRLLLATGFAVVLSGLACAEERERFILRGQGNSSCAEFAKVYRMQPDLADWVFVAGAQGYISGYNMGHSESYFDLNAKTPDAMSRLLRQYCDAHPLGDYYDAVLELMKALPVLLRPKLRRNEAG